MQLHQVHGRHRQPGTIDHAADVPVQGDVVQIVLGGLRLTWILLADIAHRQQVLVTVQRIAVQIDLGIECQQVPLRCHHERVDFNQACILTVEELDQAEQDLLELFDLISIETQRKTQPPRLVWLHPGRWIDQHSNDLFRCLCRDFLDVHAAGARGHHQYPTGLTVDQCTDIQLLGNIGRLLDQDIAHRQTVCPGLLGHDPVRQHPRCLFLDLVRRIDQNHASGLATPTGMSLRLHHPTFATQILGGTARLFGGLHRITKRHRYSVTGK